MRSLLLALALGPALALAEPPAQPPDAPAAVAPAAELTPPPPAAAPDAEAAAAALPTDLPPPPPPPSSDVPWPRFGLLLGAGAPDGAVAALVVRPLPWLRASVGPAWNYLGWGVQVGLGWTPIRWAVSPTLNVDYGHYFDADASKLARRLGNDTTDIEPLLKRVGYDYWSGQIGLELGSQRGVSFFLRGGLSYFSTSLHGTSQPGGGSSGSSDTQVRVTDPRLRAVIPSAKLGFLIFF